MVVTDKQTWRWQTCCSTEVAQRKMNRPINNGKRVESIDRVGRFSVELSRFVRLDRFQGLLVTRFRHKSLGMSNDKHSWHYLTLLILLVLNNFIQKSINVAKIYKSPLQNQYFVINVPKTAELSSFIEYRETRSISSWGSTKYTPNKILRVLRLCSWHLDRGVDLCKNVGGSKLHSMLVKWKF